MDVLAFPFDVHRDRGDLPYLPLINFFAEQSEAEGKVVLQSRPGLQTYSTFSDVPVRALYSEPGVFDGALFSVLGYYVFRNTSVVGEIDGQFPISIDSFGSNVFFAGGSHLWVYNGTTLETVDIPDNHQILRVVVGASRIIATVRGSQRFYWSDVLSTTIDALSFAEAENTPDNILDALFLGDTLILFGEASVEFWTINDDPDLPFTPLLGRAFPKGIKATGNVTKLGTSFAWVTNENKVCIGTPDNVISNRQIEVEIEESPSSSLWAFFIEGTEFLALRLYGKTWVYNTLSGSWSVFSSYGINNWDACCYANNIFGSGTSGKLMTWSEEHVDEDIGTLERRFRVWAPLNGEYIKVNSLSVRANTGTTPFREGEYENPRLEMRMSKDGGRSWSLWEDRKLGKTGEYRTYVRWLSLGAFSYPGGMFEFRLTDPVPLRVTGVYVNEAADGV